MPELWTLGVIHTFMKNITPLIIAALLVSLLAGCSKHSSADTKLPRPTSDGLGTVVAESRPPAPTLPPPPSAHPTYKDLGVVEVASGKKSRQDMGDGKVCLIDSFILSGQRIALIMAIETHDTNGAVHLISCPNIQATNDQAVGFAVGDIGVRFTPHIKP